MIFKKLVGKLGTVKGPVEADGCSFTEKTWQAFDPLQQCLAVPSSLECREREGRCLGSLAAMVLQIGEQIKGKRDNVQDDGNREMMFISQ